MEQTHGIAAPEQIGPYQILEILGQGGMGVVYRAVHPGRGELVALKTVRVPHAALLAGIRREIHALAGLRHPGIVRIVAEGVHEGLPWYAMELVEGQSLASYHQALLQRPGGCEAADAVSTPSAAPTWTLELGRLTQVSTALPRGTVPIETTQITAEPGGPGDPTSPLEKPFTIGPAGGGALPQVLALVRRLCASLAFLHGEGFVHRDLKPQNVLIRAASGEQRAASSNKSDNSSLEARRSPLAALGWPVLVDFGLIARFAGVQGRETLDPVALLQGTVAYMAPEQIRGDLVDARADLYSLGCILYELVTGRQVFPRASAEQVLRAHLDAEVTPPSKLAEGVAPELEELILRLLAKRARDRIGHAGDVAAALERLAAEPAEALTAGPPPRAYLYRPGFAGRAEALRTFFGLLSRPPAEGPALALAGGQTGAGKTRLLMELARQAAQRGAVVLGGEGRAAAGQDCPPLHPLRPALLAVADRCRELGPAETERILGPRGKLLALYEPALWTLPGLEACPEPAALPPDAARLRLFGALLETLSSFAAVRARHAAPLLLLVLDDLHLADELTLGFLEHLSRVGSETPLLVVGTYRNEETGARHAASLQRLIGAQGIVRIGMDRLEEADVGAMVRDMLGLQAPPEVFARWLALQSDGNPFFVAEYLRVAVEEGVLWRDAAGAWQIEAPGEGEAGEEDYDRLELPRSLRELLERRLGGLSPRAAAALAAASVLGKEASAALLGQICAIPETAFLEAVEELVRRQVLEEPVPGRLRFAHDKLREMQVAALDPEDRRRLHRLAAEAIEAQAYRQRGSIPARLAHHWEAAGERVKARVYFLEAARLARSRFAHAEAEGLYRAHFRLLDGPEQQTPEVYNELGYSVLRFQGRIAEAKEQHVAAAEAARQLGDRVGEARGLRYLGILYSETGKMEQALALYEQALVLVRMAKDRREEGRLCASVALVHYEQGSLGKAFELHSQALELARETGDRESEAATLSNLGILAQLRGELDRAAELFQHAVGLRRAAGARPEEGVAMGNLAITRAAQGDLEEARRLFERTLAIHREVGWRRFEGMALNNLGELSLRQGDPLLARSLSTQALAIHREVGNRRDEAITLSLLAGLEEETGRFAEARELLGRSLELHREIRNRLFEASTLVQAARLERRAGGLPAAQQSLEKAEQSLQQGGDRFWWVGLRCQQGHLALARGESAWHWLEQAQDLGRELGVKPGTELGRPIAALVRAVAAFEAGWPLVQGECPEDLPAALRQA